MPRHITKLVLPVAGLGTRCLPATKALPKEMLPVFDRPLIQYAVEEAAAAGIHEVILVTARGKGLLEDHFDRAPELEQTLSARGKQEALAAVRGVLPPGMTLVSVRQPEALGLGHAVWCARALLGNEPFAVALPDDLVIAGRGCLAQMIDAWRAVGGNMAAVEEVPLADTNRYGVLSIAREDGRLVTASGVVEKPSPETAPSRLAIIGRYILEPSVLRALDAHRRGAGNEIQLTDAIADSMATTPFRGFRFEGRRVDCGTPLGLLAGSLAVAAADPAQRAQLQALLAALP